MIVVAQCDMFTDLYYFGNSAALESLKLCPFLLDSYTAFYLYMETTDEYTVIWCSTLICDSRIQAAELYISISSMVVTHCAVVYWSAIDEVFGCWHVTA